MTSDQQYVAKVLNDVAGPDRRLEQIAIFGHSDEQTDVNNRILKGETDLDHRARYSRELAH
jgi:hypothetical protein